MNAFTTFCSHAWSRRRNRVIAVCAGVGLAGAAVLGATAAQAASSSPSPAVVSAATASPAPTTTTDAGRLRAALLGIHSLPAAQRAAALDKLKKDVLAGTYGTAAQRDLRALDAIAQSDPTGLRRDLLRLAAVHPHKDAAHKPSGSSSQVPSPSPTPAVALTP